MPEIAEVARIVHFLRKHIVGKTIKAVQANVDDIVYKDTSSAAFVQAMKGKKVVDARQKGKYFWLVMDSPPHPLMHFGMTGWMVFQQDPHTHYRSNGTEKPQDWPPRFMKFVLSTDEGNDVAFVDGRRLARIRLIDHPDGDIKGLSPLKENGPDPVNEGFDEEWFRELVKKKKAPVKAMMLNQANISGVGNWVGDEILYHAHIHPEQYCHTLTDAQIAELYKQLMFVCKTAIGLNGECEKFPKDWLFNYRWGKGKKTESKLPNGEHIDFVTVGGRTSAYVKTRQKASGPTALEGDEGNDSPAKKVPKKRGKKSKTKKEDSDEESEEDITSEEEVEEKKPAKKQKTSPPKRAAAPKRGKAIKKSSSSEESDLQDESSALSSAADESDEEEEELKPKKKAPVKAKSVPTKKTIEKLPRAKTLDGTKKKPSTSKSKPDANMKQELEDDDEEKAQSEEEKMPKSKSKVTASRQKKTIAGKTEAINDEDAPSAELVASLTSRRSTRLRK